MLYKALLCFIMMGLSGCTVYAVKGDEIIRAGGWGFKRARFADGSEIEKREPLQLPEAILPKL